MTSERPVQLSMEMALALPVMRMVVLVQREMRIDWLMEAVSSTISAGLSKFSMIHLLPSRSLRAGFLVRMLSGLGFLPGSVNLMLPDVERVGVEGTAAPARRDGFLWVCDEGSTLRRWEVTAEPWEIWSKTAPMLSGLLLEAPFVGIGGGGGGLSNEGRGGGRGGPDAADGEDTADLEVVWLEFTSFKASIASMPSLFQVTPEG